MLRTLAFACAALTFAVAVAFGQAPSASQVLGGKATPDATARLQQAMAAAQTTGQYFAAPQGNDSGVCDRANPCTAQGAFMRCHLDQPVGETCNIQLADGDYVDPEISVFYYRFASFSGNCANPSSVRLIGTKPYPTLFWVQDHAIGLIGCVRFEGYVGGVIAIEARQHAIVDYYNLVFGNLPLGTHVHLTEFSIARAAAPCSSLVTQLSTQAWTASPS